MQLRKMAALFGAIALLVTGCSNSDDGEKGNGAQATDTAKETTAEGADETSGKSAFPQTITHASGETVIEKEPESIVVLDMAALDTIDALGVGDKVVATSAAFVPSWLSDDDGVDYTKVEDIGRLQEPDMEAIAKLNPDLVIVGARSSKYYEDFAKTFTTIDASHSWDNPDYSETVPETFTMIGQAVGQQEKAEKFASDLENLMEEYKDTAADKGKALVVMTNAGEISVHDSGSRWAPIFQVFGFEEAYKRPESDEGHKGEKVSFETVKEINPDWMFVVDRDAAVGKSEPGQTAKEVLDNELIHATTAWQNEQVVYLSPERWYMVMQGASNFPAMLDEIAAAIK